MKYLLLIAIIFVAAWFWRSARTRSGEPRSAKPKTPATPMEMVACSHCGVHLPASDALIGRHGHYCTAAHRTAAEP